jgi:hypothetical protein
MDFGLHFEATRTPVPQSGGVMVMWFSNVQAVRWEIALECPSVTLPCPTRGVRARGAGAGGRRRPSGRFWDYRAHCGRAQKRSVNQFQVGMGADRGESARAFFMLSFASPLPRRRSPRLIGQFFFRSTRTSSWSWRRVAYVTLRFGHLQTVVTGV